ncbi:MAG: EAL domain-containing protein, partial [Gammaproteobacteria bacterium]|nr:EAL domain-containing protein [Gammaproteobacteria bacterium]
IPRTRELRRVVTAMNRMTQKISGLLSDLYEEVERLRSAVYEDSVTGLGNEAAFKRDLERLVADREEHAYGVVALLRMRGLDEANRANSYALGDELLKKSAAALVQIPEKYHGDAARIGGALFGIVIPDMPRSDFDNIVSPLVRELAKVKVGEFEAAGVNLGLAYYGGGQSAQVLKERAEAALNNAEREGANKWHIYDASETAAGRDLSHEKRWLEIIEVVIQRRAVVLAAQAVKSPDLEAVLHREVFARIRPGEGEAVSAGVFLPMAARVGLSERLDKTIIEATVDAVTQAPSAEGRYALNLTRYSVASGAFHDWLVKLLRNRGQEARRLCFEVAEGVVASHRDEALELAGRIRETGAQFGVDHGGARDLALEYLKRLKADYIKIDGPLITGLEDDPERQAYLKQLLATARGLDIRTVALHIESPETLAAARELGFDAFQGYHIGRPEAL